MSGRIRRSGPTLADASRVWFRFLRLETRIRIAVSNRLKAVGLSIAQCDVLTTLTEREGLSQQDLAERLYVTKGNISGLIDRLAAAGFVERRTIASDRRSHAIFLTPAGRTAAQQGIEAQQGFVTETLGKMKPEDLDEFERLLLLSRDLVRATDAPSSQ
ncbi:MAG: MarR family transcriptional regulator [Hyphomicrobiales bacterium]|nr:MarR family transcriptional regulator [Hyphomicrobiales bacterium]